MVAALAARGRGWRCPRHVIRADEVGAERLAGGAAVAARAAAAGTQRACPQASRRLACRPGQSRLVPTASRPAVAAPRGNEYQWTNGAKRSTRRGGAAHAACLT